MKNTKGKGKISKRIAPAVEIRPKQIPDFKNEDEEREFWANNDSTDFIDWENAEEAIFPNLKPTTQAISIRLSVALLDDLKSLANGMDVPYQSLIKLMLDESVKEQLKKKQDFLNRS